MSKRVTDKHISPETPKLDGRRQLSIFAPLPILRQRNSAAYNELLTRVSSTVMPADIIEEMWTRDVVDNTWEIFRLRCLKGSLLAATSFDVIGKFLAPLFVDEMEKKGEGEIKTDDIAKAMLGLAHLISNPSVRERLQKVYDSAYQRINPNSLIAQALVKELDSIERIDRLITIAEYRRNAALRELDRRRAVFAELLKAAVKTTDEEGLNAIATKANGRKKRRNDIAA